MAKYRCAECTEVLEFDALYQFLSHQTHCGKHKPSLSEELQALEDREIAAMNEPDYRLRCKYLEAQLEAITEDSKRDAIKRWTQEHEQTMVNAMCKEMDKTKALTALCESAIASWDQSPDYKIKMTAKLKEITG